MRRAASARLSVFTLRIASTMVEMLSPSPWRSRAVPAPASALTTVLLGVIVVTALYFGREVLVPIALAVLMSFVLAPLVRLLQGIYVPRIAAVIVSVLVAFALVFSLAAMMVSQVNQLASDLPSYQSTLQSKIQSLRGAAGGTGTLERASEVLKSLGRELDRPNLGGPTLSDNRPLASAPIPVEVRQPDPGALQTVVALITPLIHPLTTTGVVVIFVIFILLQRQDLRNRLIRLAGAQDLQRTTAAIDDAGQRLSRLFLTQLALNAAFGLVIGIGLWFIGVPSAPLWGMLAMILRFVPYIGAVIAAIFPLILAAAVDPGWTMVFWTAALFLTVEPIAGHAIEPLLYGHSVGMSPVAVITSATFWTWLWGPIGLILATPLTICLVVLGRHVDRLKFLDVMFGDRPPLSPPELVYQRMLAGDPMEAAPAHLSQEQWTGSLGTTRVHHAPPSTLRQINWMVPSEASRSKLFRAGNPDRAGVIHDVGGGGHVQAGCADQQQHSGYDDGEQNAVHGHQTDGHDIVPMSLHTYLMHEEGNDR